MNIEQIKELAISGNTALHAEGLQAQYDESQLNSQTSGAPVFNIFYLESLPDGPNGTKHFQVVSQFFDTKSGLEMDKTVAREKLKEFHNVDKLDATIE